MWRLALWLVLACSVAGTAFGAAAQAETPAPEAGLVVVESRNSVAETEKRLVAALGAAGLKVAARVDHAANAQSVDLKLPPTLLLIFGNPKAGTLLMEKNRLVGIDLPLKVLIWETAGKVQLAYNDPAYLARRHGLDPADPVLAQVSAVLQRFAAAAAAP